MPPAPVDNLRAGAVTTASLKVLWTATGDDGLEGTAATYDLRYLPGELTDATWDGAVRLEGEPAPPEAGAADSAVITGLSAGTAYSVGLRVADECCNWSELSNVLAATTVPEDVWLKVPSVNDGIGLDVDWVNSDSELSATWGAAAGAEGYQYAIGTEPRGVDVACWTSAGRETRISHRGLALSHSVTYYFTVRAFAGAAYGECTCSNGATVDLVPPVSAVTALPVETTALTFRLSWKGEDDLSGLISYSVRFRVGPSGMWKTWLAHTADTATYFTGADGLTLYFDCCARDVAGNVEAYPSQPDAFTTFRIAAIPKVPWVSDGLGSDEDWTNSAGYLAAHWGSVSGIEGYEYAVGTSRGGVNVVPWTSVGTDTFMSRSDMQMANGNTYYVAVRVVIGAERGASVASDGIRVDLLPALSVMNHLPAETYALVLDVSWLGSDELSGIASFDVQVKRDGLHGVWEDWLVGTTQTSARFDAEDGRAYCFRCRATDKAGNQERYPDGYDARTTFHWWVPSVPWVKDGEGADQNWTRSLTALSANWGSVMGAEAYECALGTAPGLNDLSDWASVGVAIRMTRTGLALAHGITYCASVRALVAGQRGDWVASDGITVDTVAPESRVNALPDSIRTISFRVTWGGSDDLSGVVSYDVQRKDGVSGAWVDWLNGTASKASNLTGQEGHTYYFRSRARDRAGNLEAYPEEADAFTYYKGPKRPKFALHLVPHGVADCKNPPALDDAADLVRYWPELSDVDAFLVIFDYDSLTGFQYGLDWPAEWGSCQTIACPGDCDFRFDKPATSRMICDFRCTTGASRPVLLAACHWFRPSGRGEITIRESAWWDSFLGIFSCSVNGRYEEIPAGYIYCAGVQVDPYEGPPIFSTGGLHWEKVKSLFE